MLVTYLLQFMFAVIGVQLFKVFCIFFFVDFYIIFSYLSNACCNFAAQLLGGSLIGRRVGGPGLRKLFHGYISF